MRSWLGIQITSFCRHQSYYPRDFVSHIFTRATKQTYRNLPPKPMELWVVFEEKWKGHYRSRIIFIVLPSFCGLVAAGQVGHRRRVQGCRGEFPLHPHVCRRWRFNRGHDFVMWASLELSFTKISHRRPLGTSEPTPRGTKSNQKCLSKCIEVFFLVSGQK